MTETATRTRAKPGFYMCGPGSNPACSGSGFFIRASKPAWDLSHIACSKHLFALWRISSTHQSENKVQKYRWGSWEYIFFSVTCRLHNISLTEWRWRVGDGGADGAGEGCTNASLSQPHWRWSNRAKPHAKSSQQTRRDDADGRRVTVGGGCCWVEVLEAWATALQLLLMLFQLGFDRELGI
ncbi:hypothetical protein WN944_004767 [Citrus x changshan-huyou]|uniref:Uncharacterized protein n=1 Tax=Citrus x changshan-huyou TaxID=2935761 RepID=A0AAP0M0Z4_9ROSI